MLSRKVQVIETHNHDALKTLKNKHRQTYNLKKLILEVPGHNKV